LTPLPILYQPYRELWKNTHEELDNLNNKFSERLDKINVKSQLPSTKGKQVLRNEEDKEEDKNEEEINENKKRAVRKQGEREDSDKE
jgi:hypothetical protein